MQFWALLWHVRTLTDQPIVLGAIGLTRLLPILGFSLLGGLLADRHDRRKILFFTQLVQTLVAVCLGLLTLLGELQIWHIYLLLTIESVAVAFDNPARQSLTPNLVPKTDLTSAFGMGSIASNFGAIVGPAISGFLIAGVGLQWVYWINAFSFTALIGALAVIGPVRQQQELQPTIKQNTAIGEGFKFTFSHPIIVSTMLLDFFATLFSSANRLLPFIAIDVLGVGAVAYGWLSAAQSIGAVGVALFLSQKTNLRSQGWIVMISVTFFGLATVLLGLSRSFIMAMIALILIGAADSVSTIIRNTIRQLQTPDTIRGRMIGINQIFFVGGPELGEVEAGLVAQLWGTPVAIVSGGIACVIAVLGIGLRWPQLVRYDGGQSETVETRPVIAPIP
jgi:MFS family permease